MVIAVAGSHCETALDSKFEGPTFRAQGLCTYLRLAMVLSDNSSWLTVGGDKLHAVFIFSLCTCCLNVSLQTCGAPKAVSLHRVRTACTCSA